MPAPQMKTPVTLVHLSLYNVYMHSKETEGQTLHQHQLLYFHLPACFSFFRRPISPVFINIPPASHDIHQVIELDRNCMKDCNTSSKCFREMCTLKPHEAYLQSDTQTFSMKCSVTDHCRVCKHSRHPTRQHIDEASQISFTVNQNFSDVLLLDVLIPLHELLLHQTGFHQPCIAPDKESAEIRC